MGKNYFRIYRRLITAGFAMVVLSALLSVMIKIFIKSPDLKAVIIAISLTGILIPGIVLAIVFAVKLSKGTKLEYADIKSSALLSAPVEISEAEKIYDSVIKYKGDFARFVKNNEPSLEDFTVSPTLMQQFISGDKDSSFQDPIVYGYLEEISRMADLGEKQLFEHVKTQALKSAFVKNIAEYRAGQYSVQPCQSAVEEVSRYKLRSDKSAQNASHLFYYLWVNNTLGENLLSAYAKFIELYGSAPLTETDAGMINVGKVSNCLADYGPITADEIRHMNELELDNFVFALFKKGNADILQSSMYNPNNIDFTFDLRGEKIAVLCISTDKVQAGNLDKFILDMVEKKILKGILVTNGRVKDSLRKKAKIQNIEIMDADNLALQYSQTISK